MLVESTAVCISLVDHDHKSAVGVWSQVRIDVIAVSALRASDVSIWRWKLARPCLAVTVAPSSYRSHLIFDGDRDALKGRLALGVVASGLLGIGRVMVDRAASRFLKLKGTRKR